MLESRPGPGQPSEREQRGRVHRARLSAGLRQPAGGALQQLVGRGGYAVQPAEPHDLAVEVVGLDAPRGPSQALPRRAAAALAPGDRPDPEDVAAALPVLVAADDGDARRGQRRLALEDGPVGQLPGAGTGAAAGLGGVAEVHHQLAVLPGHHVVRAARRRTRPSGTPRRRLPRCRRPRPGTRRRRGSRGPGCSAARPHPGSRWPVGIITHTPCTSSKKRSSVGSLATPFCTETTGVSGPSTR